MLVDLTHEDARSEFDTSTTGGDDDDDLSTEEYDEELIRPHVLSEKKWKVVVQHALVRLGPYSNLQEFTATLARSLDACTSRSAEAQVPLSELNLRDLPMNSSG